MILLILQPNWKESKGWKEMVKLAKAMFGNNAPLKNNYNPAKVLSNSHGVRFDPADGEVRKLSLPFNGLKGALIVRSIYLMMI
jgi:hypothetical protein